MAFIVLMNNAIPIVPIAIGIGSSIFNDQIVIFFEIRKRSYKITNYETSYANS